MSAEIDSAVIGGGVNAWWDAEGKHTVAHLLSGEEVKQALNWLVKLIPVDDHLGRETKWNMVVREDNDHPLAIVGPQFTPLQNHELIDGLIGIAGEANLQFESALSLRKGEVVAACARFPEEWELADDVYANYLNAVNYHTGLGMGTYNVGTVRMVCMNTVDAAMKTAPRFFRFRHVGNLQGRIEEAREALGMSRKYIEQYREKAEKLVLTRMGKAEFERFLKEVVPDPSKKSGEKKYKQQLPAVIRTRDGIKAVWSDTPDLANIKNTRWGALQAIAAYEDHHRKFRSDANKFIETVLEGGKYKEKAATMLMSEV